MFSWFSLVVQHVCVSNCSTIFSPLCDSLPRTQYLHNSKTFDNADSVLAVPLIHITHLPSLCHSHSSILSLCFKLQHYIFPSSRIPSENTISTLLTAKSSTTLTWIGAFSDGVSWCGVMFVRRAAFESLSVCGGTREHLHRSCVVPLRWLCGWLLG